MRSRTVLLADRCASCGAPLAYGRECFARALHSDGADSPAPKERGPLSDHAIQRVYEARNFTASYVTEIGLSVSSFEAT